MPAIFRLDSTRLNVFGLFLAKNNIDDLLNQKILSI